MISHKYKIIFIHIPKCAGSSISDFYFDQPKLDWRTPNYNLLYGWCPERKIHMQHATPKELLETELIDKDIWKSYFKFAFVRNPWDRAYSDYLWLQKDRNIRGGFKDYLHARGCFKTVLNDRSEKGYRGDHLTTQSEYVADANYPLDFIGRFENLHQDISLLNSKLNIEKPFNMHAKNNTKNKLSHYSKFYTNSNKQLVEEVYHNDIKTLNYNFEDVRTGLSFFKSFF
jgi:hypothetical protein